MLAKPSTKMKPEISKIARSVPVLMLSPYHAYFGEMSTVSLEDQ